MRRIYVLDSYFNYFLELPQGRLLIQETCWISTLVLGWYGFFLLRATAFDFCKVKRGKDGGTLRTMSGEKLLKTLPVLQAQVLKFAAGKRECFKGETLETPVKEVWLEAFYPKVDALLEFDCSAQDLNNGVINCSFMLLFRDLIRSESENHFSLKYSLFSRLFACYNDGVINLLEKYFDMQKKGARDALGIVAF